MTLRGVAKAKAKAKNKRPPSYDLGEKYRMCSGPCGRQRHVNQFVQTSNECRDCRNLVPPKRKLRPMLPSPTEREREAVAREMAKAEEHIRQVKAELERRPVPVSREPRESGFA